MGGMLLLYEHGLTGYASKINIFRKLNIQGGNNGKFKCTLYETDCREPVKLVRILLYLNLYNDIKNIKNFEQRAFNYICYN